MQVTLFKPDAPCNQCHATKLHLNREKIPFTEVIADDATADQFREWGYASYPVVVVEIDGKSHTWAGYRRDEIKKFAEMIRN